MWTMWASLSLIWLTQCYWQYISIGAYGAAVLYRKKDDDSLVILKEINMHDLNAAERQLALNEVCVTKSGLKVKVLDKGW